MSKSAELARIADSLGSAKRELIIALRRAEEYRAGNRYMNRIYKLGEQVEALQNIVLREASAERERDK